MDNTQLMQQLNDEIYYQKLGILLKALNQWRTAKKTLLIDIYYSSILHILDHSQAQQNKLYQQVEGLIEIINCQREFYLGVKCINLKKVQQKLSHGRIDPLFLDTHKSIENKIESILEIKKHISTFWSELNNQLLQVRKYFGKFENIKKQLIVFQKQIEKLENKAIEAITLRKNRKVFNLKSYQIVKQVFKKQIRQAAVMTTNAYNSITKLRQNYNQLLQLILKNINQLTVHHRKCFNQEFGEQLIIYYQAKKEANQHILEQTEKEKRDTVIKEKQNHKKINEAMNNLQEIVQKSLNEITVWSLQVKMQQGKEGKTNTMAHITIDNMLLFTTSTVITHQIDLIGVKVEECPSESTVIVKKKPQSIKIQFDEEQRMDEFLLHLSRINSN